MRNRFYDVWSTKEEAYAIRDLVYADILRKTIFDMYGAKELKQAAETNQNEK